MKYYHEIKIERKDYLDTLKVRVYKTNKMMVNGCNKTCKYLKIQKPIGIYNGVWINVPYAKCKYSNELANPLMFGLLLLNEEYLTTDIIAHECLHAAFAHNKYINNYIGKYDKREQEEELAHYFQWLLLNVNYELKKARFKVKDYKK